VLRNSVRDIEGVTAPEPEWLTTGIGEVSSRSFLDLTRCYDAASTQVRYDGTLGLCANRRGSFRA
jgi:hypothetical protein